MSAPSPGFVPERSSSAVDELTREVRDLQRRVLDLEQRLPQPASRAATPPPLPHPEMHVPSNALPVIGRALLAIAGAYVLRALTELGVFSPAAGVSAGLIYAFAWLFVAARLPITAKLAVTVNTLTAVAIMAPLVWEAATRLNAISSWTCAAAVAGFGLLGMALSSRKRVAVIGTLATVSGALMAATLLLATHDVFPFTLTLLVIAAALEFEGCCGRENGSRWLTALLADLAVLLFSWLLSRPQGLPEGYVAAPAWAALATQLLLVVIYAGSAVMQTLVLRRIFTLFEAMQTAAAVLIGFGGAASMMAANSTGMLALGLSALIAGVGCYVVSFVVVPPANKWNFRAWATFGLLLVLAGTFLPFSGSSAWALWCASAVVCCWAALAAQKPTLGLHGAAYLLLAAIVSGAASQAALQLFGDGRSPVAWLNPALVGVTAALSWVAMDRSSAGESGGRRKQIASLVMAATLVWIAAAAMAHAVVWLWPATRNVPADTLATVVLTALSVALAWAGVQWQRKELVWVVYGIMIVAAWKLATRDFPQEHNLSLVISLLCYGGALMILPRIVQRRPRAHHSRSAVAAS